MKAAISPPVVAACLVVAASGAPFQPAPHPDLGADPVTAATCGECHAEAQESMQKGAHAPLVGHCPMCHEIKGAETPYLLLSDAQLCDRCHRLPVWQGSPAPPSVEITPGVTVAHELLPVTRQIRVDDRLRGHPVANHPIANVPDALHPGRQLSCRSCHAAHGAAPRMLTFDLKPGENICKKCHDM